MTGWASLLTAGVVEVAWARSIAPTNGFTRVLPSALCLVLMAAAVYLLSRAMTTIPAATAYVVFTGIGAAGTVLAGALLDHDPLGAARLAALALITGGVVLARISV